MMNKDFRSIQAYPTGWILAVTDWFTVMPWLFRLARKTADSLRLEFYGDQKQIERDIHDGAFFLTNHRDICMDSAWLTLLLRHYYGIHPFIGIGNNLFGKWWIEWFVRFNHCFVVKRGGTPREIYDHSLILCRYIRRLRRQHKSIWLAQREGRAKDGNDRTQAAVLKMLTMGQPDFLDAIRDMNICPVSLSYEYDPCDYLKAAEMQLRRDNPDWKKSPQDDILSMKTGITGYKGRVVCRLTPSINPELEAIRRQTAVRNEQIRLTAELIDRHIFAAYEIFPRGKEFDEYIESRLALIDIPNKDEAFLRDKLYEMYNYPARNQSALSLNNPIAQ
ncbi:MAG: acyltransferase [Paludibacteraceae bacterium]|nr:acyltransferase [Paludibacteraceae bacterium]